MGNAGPILNYVSPTPPPGTLTLEESDGAARVIFVAPPTWVYMLLIVTWLTVGLVKAVAGILLARTVWQLVHRTGRLTSDQAVVVWRMVAGALTTAGISALCWWALAAYEWRMYHRWGRVPRVLTANDESLTLSRLGWWRMRQRVWPANDITAVELRPVKGNLLWKRTVADLYLFRRHGRRLRFRLSSPDPLLPGRIAQRLASALRRLLA
jgi:hypothetical protein